MQENIFLCAQTLGLQLLAQNATVATAESCTGGGLAQAITEVPGASGWFGTGFVTYSNAAKIAQLGVEESALAVQGAVSELVAEQMAQGARQAGNATWGVSTTGIAGPDGGTQAKPVGTVWFAWIGPQTQVSERQLFTGDRASIRLQATHYALAKLNELLKNTV